MDKNDKRLNDWSTITPPEAPLDEVRGVLKHFLPSYFTEAGNGGSHQLRLAHPALFEHPHFVGGTLSIPVRNGRVVKRIYLKRIIEAIKIIQEREKADQTDEEGS